MRAFISTLAVVVCVAFLAYGHFYWKDKTKVTSISADAQSATKETETKKPNKKEENETVDLKVLEYAINWPEEAQKSFRSAIENSNKYKIAIVGSQALGGKDGWANMLKEELVETYGEDAIKVKLFQYDDINSDQFIQDGQMDEVKAAKPDLVLFEPFKLNDNGVVGEEENHDNIEIFIDAIADVNSNAVVIIHPTHPISGGARYANQVALMKKFAEQNEIPYLDHWTVWPDRMSEEIKQYLPEDQSAPNQKGNELLYEYFRDYFIAD
ncbi:SGNH/GDSL hydrolase family protein [Lederbergia citrea]|uniref:SGNH/GDSL hydrolase family protein n=1 Tax=Lederbergia citrea TaxID=2833581 RepID=UPI001BCA5820|nr:SGNH/GDSL hydrolase family protein [Lederbergia citrea]MBS4178115.1 SGNH/GDSL hydrolase family protein [Lederbergia citrea]